MASFGDRLKEFRDARGWSQERVGFEVDVTKATISKWETGRAEPGLQNLAKLRRVFAPFGLTLDYLIDDEYVMPGPSYQNDAGGRPPVRVANSEEEVALLMRFRALKAPRQRGLLEFLAE